MGAIANVTTTLTSAVADDGTLVVAYPSGTNQAMLQYSTGGKVMVGQDGPYTQGVTDHIDITFGASDITITNRTTRSWPIGTEIRASFGDTDRNGSYNPPVAAGTPTVLTAATGTASNTVADVGAAFSQTTLNNNFKSLATKVNEILAILGAADAS